MQKKKENRITNGRKIIFVCENAAVTGDLVN